MGMALEWIFVSLVSMCVLAMANQAPKGFISIDCGAVVDSIDEPSGIPFQSDKDLIKSGVIGQISPEFADKYFLRTRTLRSFPDGVKNCYTLRPESGENNNYLIRAAFFYGNYDGNKTPPAFTIYLGVNLWATIDSNDTVKEAIYMAPTPYIDVCLVNIGNGVPYISTLELRPLDNSIYRSGDQIQQFLMLWNRYDVGGEDRISYPLDVVDRMWYVYDEIWSSTPLKKIQTNSSITRSSDDPYKLPESMLQTAYGTLNSSTPFVFDWYPYSYGSTFYFCFHFAEIEKVGSVREMSIVLNDIHTIAPSVKLQYLKPQTICSTSIGLPVNHNGNNYLRISAASGSDLPPIINGFEVLYFMEISHSPTFLQDVNAVNDIKKTFDRLNSVWQGDPCLPEFSIWSGLNCSRSDPPRIISLNLSSSKLTGEIPFSISNLTQLETLDLSYNDLSGSLPEFLAQLPRLKTLNLSGNNLDGVVPESLLVKSRDGVLDLRVDDNPELCLSPPCKKKKKKVSVLPIIIAVVGAIILVICLVLLLIYKRNKNKNSRKLKEKTSLKQKQREYSYSEVVSITNNFRDIIGEGGFGKVYKGALKDKTLVAVKLLSSASKQGQREFQTEAELLMIVHHRNLVSLVGYCDEGDTKALIYEYMVNGNLWQRLSEKNTNILSWNERLQIAVDAAHGLEYLHNGCKPTIVHRDLKPANILLDDMMQAKIADFGLSRTFQIENQSQMLTQLAGTPGYFDPESQTLGNLNKKSDVYSFGIILFELITGCPAITRSYNGSNIHLLNWVVPIINKRKIEDVVDVRIKGEVDPNSAYKMAEIAMLCTQPTGDKRPDISIVLEELKECLAMELERSTLPESSQLSSSIIVQFDAGPRLR